MHAVISRFFFFYATVLVLLAMPGAGAVALGEPTEQSAAQHAPNIVEEPTSADPNPDQELGLQLSSEWHDAVLLSEGERDLLRLIYRTLVKRDVQIDNQLALADMLLQMQQDTEQLKANAQQQGVSIPALPPPAIAAVLAPNKFDLLTFIGPIDVRLLAAMGMLLLLLFVVLRRQRVTQTLLSPLEPKDDFKPGQGLSPEINNAEGDLDQDTVLSLEVPPDPALTRVLNQPPDHWQAFLNQQSANTKTRPANELAELILSIGHVSGADEILQKYIQLDPKQALQQWIHLLEIYRENGKRAEFETLSVTLNQNFNVECVLWDNVRSVDQLEMTLQLLPHIRDRVDASWGRPECLDYLMRLLLNNRNGERHGFSLAVTKEILILIDLMAAEKESGK